MVFSLSLGATLAYSLSTYKWGGTSVNYYINSTFALSFRTAMQSADSAWDNAGSKFKFNYAGITNRNPNVWATNHDGYSDIGHYNFGNTGNMIAGSDMNITNGTTTITETDTTFNTYYSFTTVGANGMYDVQNTMTHEFGHWLKLLDLSSGFPPSWCGWEIESTMCGTLWTGETRKRSLEGDDKDGIKAKYGI